MSQHSDVALWASQHEQSHPREIINLALDRFERVAISFSGAEDVALIDLAASLRRPFAVFTLDTGRLHPETYRFLEKVRKHYKVDMEVLFPNSAEVEALVRSQGLFDFYERGHKDCCRVRKVAPLRRKLATLDAWITGQRRDQSEATRSALDVVEIDQAFSTPDHTLVKFNPLATWSSSKVWSYLREREVPVNDLHRHGFISIGCEPCTRPVLPSEHERNGRWWWEEAGSKECGLHQRTAQPAEKTAA